MGVCGSPFLTSNANTLIHAFAYRVNRVMAANQQQPAAPAPGPASASVRCVALFRLTHTSDCRCRIVEETKKPLGGRGGRRARACNAEKQRAGAACLRNRLKYHSSALRNCHVYTKIPYNIRSPYKRIVYVHATRKKDALITLSKG